MNWPRPPRTLSVLVAVLLVILTGLGNLATRTEAAGGARRWSPRPAVDRSVTAAPLAPNVIVSVGATKDNTLYQNSTGARSNGEGQYMFVGTNAGGDRRRAVVAFDVASNVPNGSTIVSATLRLHMSRTSSGSRAVSLHRLLASWGEGTSVASGQEGAGAESTVGDATWMHRYYDMTLWSSPGGDFATAVSDVQAIDVTGYYTWGSTAAMVADVQAWLDTPSSNRGWLLLGNESIVRTAKRFDTRQNTSAERRPRLTISYTAVIPPTPTATGTPPTPTPTSSATGTATASPTASPTASATRSATPTVTGTATTTPTATATSTPGPTNTATALIELTATATATSTSTATASPTTGPVDTATSTPLPTSTDTPAATATATATSTSTATSTPPPTTTPPPTATSTLPPTASSTPLPTDTPTPAQPALVPGLCPFILNRVPAVVINWSLANPQRVNGWGQRAIAGLPPSPFNPPRKWLSLSSIGLPYHPLFNGLAYKAGCP